MDHRYADSWDGTKIVRVPLLSYRDGKPADAYTFRQTLIEWLKRQAAYAVRQ
jgi:hypothetical protein